eukprot:c38540_g1_i1 orf=133-378(+)
MSSILLLLIWLAFVGNIEAGYFWWPCYLIGYCSALFAPFSMQESGCVGHLCKFADVGAGGCVVMVRLIMFMLMQAIIAGGG